jgi:glycosyltransferase involved in cell wall biosynthesis
MAEVRVSGIIHTRNSEATIEAALRSLDWADELLVMDMESSDRTTEIAGRYPCVMISIPPAPRVDGVRNSGLARCHHDWVFVLDADEYLAEGAGEQFRGYIRKHGGQYDAFAIPRYNYICGQVMRGSRWYPDQQIRLFRKGTVMWEDAIHRPPLVVTNPARLMGLPPQKCPHIHHRNYDSIDAFLRRQLEYALADHYDRDAEAFDFSDYVADAYKELALRTNPEADGDLSHALSLLLAWDQVVRGLIHWGRLSPRPPLGYLKALPVACERLPWWRIHLNRLLARHYSLGFLARRPREMLRWWRWQRTLKADARSSGTS